MTAGALSLALIAFCGWAVLRTLNEAEAASRAADRRIEGIGRGFLPTEKEQGK